MITLTLQQRSDQIRAKLADGYRLPPDEALMNSGRRRTERKRELLRSIDEAARERGQTPAFRANY